MKILGHRGAAGTTPENTLISFVKGLELGVDGFEFDVQLSRDREVVIIHDERVDRTSDGIGWVKDYSLKELKSLNFGVGFKTYAPIPTLEELLEMFQDKSLIINVEIKTGLIQYPGIVAQVAGLLEKYNVTNQSIISSFEHRTIVEVIKDFPNLKTGLLYECGLISPWLYAQDMGASHLHPHYAFISPELVRECHARGIGVNTWTVNEEWEIERAIVSGADIAITNYPERFSHLRSE
ncbi:glycerophosphodiester phosphodiesterase [Desulfosporosinus meridiei]|uniref:Glycerophosphoryl diester phosphodiesterase n=1 Tax=Desulfosporosinus meridiei (strain ATCC BAA-275 / DSM 13257 / KCTC 12902 / NCIMB 13706 / S10) TaxID=768704 RepID=J7J1W5_DESMD|nr:glycerophosphodiester phosphodiesterase [Desulfosporosinus meridiei]AFQ46314.1 glycerophosphoryl diester phosphodiesterase [Desulfosporosinus meridiei DSM 13257]